MANLEYQDNPYWACLIFWPQGLVPFGKLSRTRRGKSASRISAQLPGVGCEEDCLPGVAL